MQKCLEDKMEPKMELVTQDNKAKMIALSEEIDEKLKTTSLEELRNMSAQVNGLNAIASSLKWDQESKNCLKIIGLKINYHMGLQLESLGVSAGKPKEGSIKLSDIGLTPFQSMQYKRLTKIPYEKFLELIKDPQVSMASLVAYTEKQNEDKINVSSHTRTKARMKKQQENSEFLKGFLDKIKETIGLTDDQETQIIEGLSNEIHMKTWDNVYNYNQGLQQLITDLKEFQIKFENYSNKINWKKLCERIAKFLEFLNSWLPKNQVDCYQCGGKSENDSCLHCIGGKTGKI